MRRKIAIFASTALALAVMLPATAQGPADKATGGVAFASAGEFIRDVAFNAQGTAGDAKGRVNVRNHGPTGGIDFKGDVDCYNNMGPNSATFSGVITHFDGPAFEDSGFFRISVEDHGTPGTHGPDRISVNRSDAPFDCPDAHTPGRNVLSGDLVVQNATP